MVDLTRTRTREQEPIDEGGYEYALRGRTEALQRGMNGQIVVRDSDREWELNRQGFLKFYLLGDKYPETALQDWWVFVHDVRKTSGKHRHQGGLVLFVLEGRGATEVNGEIIEWEKGDCVLLPLHPDGVEHVHYNRGTEPAKWIAFVHVPAFDFVASEMVQTDINPNFQNRAR